MTSSLIRLKASEIRDDLLRTHHESPWLRLLTEEEARALGSFSIELDETNERNRSDGDEICRKYHTSKSSLHR